MKKTIHESPTPSVEPSHNVQDILKVRTAQYGMFRTIALTSQGMKSMMERFEGWGLLEADQKEALEMIVHKIARILNGNPNLVDSWEDIAGYAILVAERIKLTK